MACQSEKTRPIDLIEMIEDAGLVSAYDFPSLRITNLAPVTGEKDPAIPTDQFIDIEGHLLVERVEILCFVKSK